MKKKILIVSSNYPFGQHETFLENEINYLSKYFDLHIIPMYKNKKSDVARKLPKNVTFSMPILKTNQLERMFKGIFNRAPLFINVIEIFSLLKQSNKILKSFYQLYVNFTNFRSLISNKEFSDSLINSKIDIIYFYWGNIPAKSLKSDKPIFIRIHGSEIYKDRNNNYIAFDKLKFINAENITYLPISEIAAKHIHGYSPLIRYKVNRLGVYDKGINPNENLNIIRVVSCSTLIPLKRVNLIIDSLSLISDKKVEWIHFGDGPLLQILKFQAKELSKNISVSFKGRVDNIDLLSYYAKNKVNVFVNVSETEGVPVSVMEALSFGIPCFVTDVGGTSEIVDNSVGKLVEKHFNITELKNFIIETENVKMITPMRIAARKRWEELSNAKKNYHQLVKIL